MTENKDHRSTNFCQEETKKLMLLLMDFPVITCKKTDHASNNQKEAAWKLLADKFNSDATKFRSIRQLQQKYSIMKKTAKKEIMAEKFGRKKTGGGPPPPKPSETIEWLNSAMGESISGLTAIYDSDAIVVPPKETHLEGNINNYVVPVELNKEDTSFKIDAAQETFDSSTPKSMLGTPMAKELYTQKKNKTCTLQEARKQLIVQSNKKIDLLSQKQAREQELSKFAHEEHTLNMQLKKAAMQHLQEIHDLQKNIYLLMTEKLKYEVEKSKLELKKITE